MARLVLHINREALHHGAEIALLRDLYAYANKLTWARLLAGRASFALAPASGGHTASGNRPPSGR